MRASRQTLTHEPSRVTTMNNPNHFYQERMVTVIGPEGHVRRWAEIEAEVIECAILSCNGNVTAAAAALRTGRGLFYRRIRALAFPRN